MTLVEHLRELRNRVLKVVVAVAAGTVAGFLLFEPLLDLLLTPYCDVPASFRPGSGDECSLVAVRPLEPLSLRLKLSVLFGVFVAGPWLFFQVWRFIAPGLTRREKRLSAPFVIASQLMFAAGIAFSAFVIPRGLEILLGFAGDRVAPLLSADTYLDFLLATAAAFGLVFELPVLLVFLSLLGIVKARGLRRFRPHALVLNVVVAAIITPTTDAITLFFMAGPMALFYELSILGAWLIERRRSRVSAGAGT